MSSSGHDSSPLQSTRQMLDELDALMERMLSLPVGEEEELPPLPRDVLKTPTLSASLTVLDEPRRDIDEQEENELYAEKRPRARDMDDEVPSLFPREPITPPPAPRMAQEPVEPPVEEHHYYTPPAAEPEEEKLPPPLLTHRPVQVVTSPPRPRFAPGRMCLKPLVWANQSFDHCTRWLGPLGRVIRGPKGRSFLGFMGLASLGAAGIWYFKQQMGWSW